jgi:hypothetical protein
MTLGAMAIFALRHFPADAPPPAGARPHMENIEPSFIARPMSPLTFSLPDMNSI